MPTHTYMVVDRRHDHSLRIPRPDLSVKLGTPNACNDCHTDKSAEWAAAAIESWYGPNREGFQNYAEAFHAAWADQPDAAKLLAAVAADGNTPAFARASALTDLAPSLSPTNGNLARAGLSDPDPMVRLGALDMLESVPAVSDLAACFAATLRSQPWRAHQGGFAARCGSDREPACRRSRTVRARSRRVYRCATPQCRSAGIAFGARKLSWRSAAVLSMRRPNTRLRCS